MSIRGLNDRINCMEAIRTRIAPSPTGADLHIGNAYTALINYVVAAKAGGQFIIRIEDTDRTRLVNGAEEKILQSLHWLGIAHHEGPDIGGPYEPYRQSERLEVYKKYAEELVQKGHAYFCYCTPERLEKMRKEQQANHMPPMYDGHCKTGTVQKTDSYVIRLHVPDTGVTTFTDLIRGEITFENALIDDQVLLKSDGYPTYHLGVVVDDHIMQISHIIRGEEWIPSTPKHVLLYQFFGWEMPKVAHVSVLRNPDKSKLSKRKNPVWVSDYKAKGFLPEAIRNYLATMAWSYKDGRDIFTTEEMIQIFDISQIKTTAPIFDVEKLRWMNGEYIRVKTDTELTDLIVDFYHDMHLDKETVKSIIPLVRERMRTLAEFWSLSSFFFERPTGFSKPKTLPQLYATLSDSDWSHEAMEHAIRASAEKENMKAKELFMDLRIAVTGKSVGPPLLESLELLGKEETLSRLV